MACRPKHRRDAKYLLAVDGRRNDVIATRQLTLVDFHARLRQLSGCTTAAEPEHGRDGPVAQLASKLVAREARGTRHEAISWPTRPGVDQPQSLDNHHAPMILRCLCQYVRALLLEQSLQFQSSHVYFS